MAKCSVEGFCASNRHKLIQLTSHSNDHNINLWSSWKHALLRCAGRTKCRGQSQA
ncbi:hypothetical protein Plhal304r1_c005g0018771 [Plasmopara halstedii]